MYRLSVLFSCFIFLAGCATTDNDIQNSQHSLKKAALINAELSIDYTSKNMLSRSKEKLLNAKKLDSSIDAIYYAEGYFYQKLGLYKKSEKSYIKSIKMSPNNSKAVNFYAQFLCSVRSKYKHANSLFKRSILMPDNINLSSTLNMYTECLVKQGNFKLAIETLKQSVKQNSKINLTNFYFAISYYQTKKYKLAYSYINEYLKNTKASRKALNLKLKILESLGEKNKAALAHLRLNSFQ